MDDEHETPAFDRCYLPENMNKMTEMKATKATFVVQFSYWQNNKQKRLFAYSEHTRLEILVALCAVWYMKMTDSEPLATHNHREYSSADSTQWIVPLV